MSWYGRADGRQHRRLAPAAVLALALLPLAALLAACSGAADGSPSSVPGAGVSGAGVPVVTTSSVFADLVRQVGGNRVDVVSLVPRGVDPHTFEPKPSDAARLAGARLIVMNGLGLDDWLAKTIESSGSTATVVRLGENLPGVEYIAGGGAVEPNPHLWLDVSYAMKYVDRLADALAAADPAGATAYRDGAAAYRTRLVDLDRWVRDEIATIPAVDRKLVMYHDAFPYFTRAYGLTAVGTIVDAAGQEPSAGEMAALIDAVRASGARAVFSEAQFPPNLVQRLADETGARVVSDLYDDALGDPPLDTYEAIIRHDVEQLVTALRPAGSS